jgi:hypothetical protein
VQAEGLERTETVCYDVYVNSVIVTILLYNLLFVLFLVEVGFELRASCL